MHKIVCILIAVCFLSMKYKVLMQVTLVNWPLQKSSGLCSGSITNSFKVSLTFSRAPISSNVTPISSGGITSARSFFSNSFSVTTSYSCQETQLLHTKNQNVKSLTKKTVTLSDFFEFLDSFCMDWRIPIPYWMLKHTKWCFYC